MECLLCAGIVLSVLCTLTQTSQHSMREVLLFSSIVNEYWGTHRLNNLPNVTYVAMCDTKSNGLKSWLLL